MAILKHVLTIFLAILPLVSVCSAAYAVLSITRDPSVPDNKTELCAVFNDAATHLNTTTAPTPHSYIETVSNTSYDPYGCTAPPEQFGGEALVILRGNCTFVEKAYLAEQANASMVVIVYNVSKVTSPVLNDSITIPVLMVDNSTGQTILDMLSTAPLYLYGYLPPGVTFDPSGVVLSLIAVVTVFVGSIIASEPYEFMRYGLLLRKGETPQGQSSVAVGNDKVSVVGVIIGVVLMIAIVCGLLLLLYFFYYPMVFIVLALYTVAAVFALYNLLSPFVALIPFGDFRIPTNKIPILRYRPGLFFILTALFSVAIATWWAVERHAVYAWVLQDILGFAFITMLYQRLSFLKPWIVALLMVVLFFYDIFMVFITPYFTNDGVSVMEKAAVGPPGSTERLPLVFTVMKFIYPTRIDTVCSLPRSYGLLGYGDVGIPGLLVTLALKHDLRFGRSKCCQIYYATSGIAYIVGLVCTYIALTYMKTAQPALLYLVPTTLLATIVVSLIRQEFMLFFTGKRKELPPPKSTAAHSESENEPSINNDNDNDTDSEKSPLVHKSTST